MTVFVLLLVNKGFMTLEIKSHTFLLARAHQTWSTTSHSLKKKHGHLKAVLQVTNCTFDGPEGICRSSNQSPSSWRRTQSQNVPVCLCIAFILKIQFKWISAAKWMDPSSVSGVAMWQGETDQLKRQLPDLWSSNLAHGSPKWSKYKLFAPYPI